MSAVRSVPGNPPPGGPLSEPPEIGGSTPPLVLRGITKRYGKVTACDAVDMTVRDGEIHGLLGENGAGKSTLMKVLLGLVLPDDGTIFRNGARVRIDSPFTALNLGIGMVHQHFSLIEALTVWENVVLGERGAVVRAAACADIERVGARYGLPIDPYAVVNTLSAGQRQRVELIKCLRRDPRLLILDEPTSVLTTAESAELFGVLRNSVAVEGRSVILISHKLGEIAAATDRVTVLRRGRVVYRGDTAVTTMPELARQMVGRPVHLGGTASDDLALHAVARRAHPPAHDAAPALMLDAVTVRDTEGTVRLDELSLNVRAGEILGLYGVEGNGQAELEDLLSGLLDEVVGTVTVGGAVVDPAEPGALTGAKVGVIPEDRHRSGIVLDMSIAENLAMKDLRRWSRHGRLDRRRIRIHGESLIREFNIAAPGVDTPIRSLSGGNQQKVVLARELSAEPTVLVAAQPTHGLDVGAIEHMYTQLRAAADAGVAILLISTEIDEVLALSDRIAVLSSGRVSGILTPDEATDERLGMMLGGAEAAA